MCFNEVLIRTSIPLCILIANKLRSVADPRYIVTQTVVGCSRRYQLLKKVGGGHCVGFFFTSMIVKNFLTTMREKGRSAHSNTDTPPPHPPHTQAYMSRQKRRKVDQNVDNAEDMNAHFNS